MDNSQPTKARRTRRRWRLPRLTMTAAVRLLRLPLDVLFLTWDYLRLTCWGIVQLGAPIWGVRQSRFGTRTEADVVGVGTARVRRCTVGRKYANQIVLKLLLPRVFAVWGQHGRRTWVWEPGGAERPTTLTRYVAVGLGLGLLWGSVALLVLVPGVRQALRQQAGRLYPALPREGGQPVADGGSASVLRAEAHSRAAMDAQGQDPVAAKAIDERILRLVDAGRPLEALACCRDAMARYPAEVILRERLCRLLLPLGWDNELYDAAIALLGEQPGNAVAHLHLAILFHRKGLSSLAIEHCNRALAQMPGLKTALHLQASALMQRGAFEEAAQLLEAIRREVPADVLFRVQLAECYLRQERSPEALALLRETVQADPDATVARAQLAQALYLAGRREEALAEFQAVRKVSPHDVLTLNNVAVISTSLGGDLDEALRCALRALELDPGNPQVIDTVGWVHFARKEYERALSMAALASTLAPDRPVILYHHAEVLAARGRDREARDALRRALALDIRFAEKERAAELLRQLDARGTAPSAQP